MLAKGFYKAVVDSVWERDGSFGPYWEWHFKVGHYKLKAFTSGNLKNEKTRQYLGAVLGRNVEPDEEFLASYLGGESCTVEIGTTMKNGREYNTIENVI